MRTADQQIADILVKYGEPFAGSVWRVQGTAVILHKTLERIAAAAGIKFDPPTIVRAERDECVILVTGRMGRLTEWSLGEAAINQNYKVSGKQAAYPFAMSEKRAKDRVILKLIGLSGDVYSEQEADEWRGGPGEQMRAEPPANDFEEPDPFNPADEVEAQLKKEIDRCESINAVTDLMLDQETQRLLNGMPAGRRDEVRDYAKARLVALGWPSKSKPGRPRKEPGPGDEVPPAPRRPAPVAEPEPELEPEPEDPPETLASLLQEVTERMSHARTAEEVEEAYVDADAEPRSEAFSGGLEAVRAARDERMAAVGPTLRVRYFIDVEAGEYTNTDGEWPADRAGVAFEEVERARYERFVADIERQREAEKVVTPTTAPAEQPVRDTADAYAAELKEMCTRAKTAQELQRWWEETAIQRDSSGASAQRQAKWKQAKTKYAADLPQED